MLPYLVVWTLFLALSAGAFYRELKRTPWDLLESLLLFVVIGHVIALPTAWGWQAYLRNPNDEWLIYAMASGGLVLGMFMAGGAIWAFRRLNRMNEQRRRVRLKFLACGVLLFPSMVGFIPAAYFLGPMGLVVVLAASIPVWMEMTRLNATTAYLPDPGQLLDQREQAWQRQQLRRRMANPDPQHAPQQNDAAEPDRVAES